MVKKKIRKYKIFVTASHFNTKMTFFNSSLVELQFLPQLKPIEISHSNMVGAEEEQQLKTGASDSSSSWSLGQLTLLRTKKDGSKRDLLTSVLVNSFKG